ncbi:hypothetical protein NBRC116494_30590 [Aurantivibrio plasticivorans]
MRFLANTTLLCLCTALPLTVNAGPKIYKYVDSKGRVTYSDRSFHDGYVELKKSWKGWVDPGTTNNYRENKKKYRTLIAETSKTHEVPNWLVHAVIHAESFYNSYAVSSAGAVGLMQLMPGTAQRYGVTNRQDPRQNISGGVRYLKDLLEMFDGNVELAVAAYNAGENAVKKHGNRIPPYRETKHYVRKVSELSQRYKSQTI